jgi:hypothetical protein
MKYKYYLRDTTSPRKLEKYFSIGCAGRYFEKVKDNTIEKFGEQYNVVFA